ncbi:MAG TPA: hypothetical protein VMM13_14045, partial [Euzebya sp.]|nr:hypothetical protein [Euzebya sp.]
MGPTPGGSLVAATPQQALDTVQARIGAIQDSTPDALQQFVRALVWPAGVRGSVLVHHTLGRLEVLASAGVVPDRLDTPVTRMLAGRTAVVSSGLLAVPVPCPQIPELALVADIGGDAHDDPQATALVVEAAAHMLGLRLELLDT